MKGRIGRSIIAKRALAHLGGIVLLAAPVRADRYAVLIGINTYEDSRIPSLSGAAADARSLAKTLIESDGFPRDHVHLLVSDHQSAASDDPSIATRENIYSQFDWLDHVVKSGDTVFFFFAGHGTQFSSQAWLMPYNTKSSGPRVFENSAIPANKILEYLNGLPPCLLVTAYDMCRKEKAFEKNSGSRGLGLGFRMGDLQERSVTVGHPGKTEHPFERNAVTMFACKPSQFSYESYTIGRGYFSKSLEEVLSQGADQKGRLSVFDMVSYVRERVMASEEAFGLTEPQEPVSVASSDSVYRQIFASGLKPGTGIIDAKAAMIPGNPSAADLKSRNEEDEYTYLFHRGFSLYLRKKFRSAEIEFEKALVAKRTPSVLRIIGDCRHFQGDNKGAEKYFNLALEVDTGYSPAYCDLGYLEDHEFRHPAKAEALYGKAMACDPDNPTPVNNLSRVFEELKRPVEALEMCRRAVELDPNSGLFEANLALELNNQNHKAEALEHALRAKELGLKHHLIFERLNIQE